MGTMPNRPQTEPLGGVPAPLIFAGGIAAGLAVQRVIRLPLGPRRLMRRLGVVLMLAGGGLVAWSVSTMRRADTSPNPHDAVTAVVETGPYAYSRNPIYVGYALVHAGLALTMNALWPALALQPALRLLARMVIEPEETYLEKHFGRRYKRYRDRVPRWL